MVPDKGTLRARRMTLAIFSSEKRTLLGRVRKRDWSSQEEMKAVFIRLIEQDLKIGDVVWMLNDPDRLVRHFAAQIIVKKQLPNSVPALLKEATGKEGKVRDAIIGVIPQVRDPVLLSRLERLLGDKDPKAREVAYDTILVHPTKTVGPLLTRMLRSEYSEQRHAAVKKLGADVAQGGEVPKEWRRVVVKLVRDEDERIAMHCVEIVAASPDKEVLDLLVEQLTRASYMVKKAIIEAFATFMARPELKMIDRLLPLLSQGDDMVRSAALTLTIRHGDPKDIIRRILLMQTELMGWMRERILRTVREFGDELIAPIAELLEYPDENVQKKALIFAADFESPLLVEPAMRLLNVKDWWTRIIAMDLLGRLKDDRAVEALIDCLMDDDVRWSAVEALTRIGGAKALGPIARLLGDPQQEVRLQVIRALELYNDPRVLPMLMKAMQADPVVEVRERALAAYRMICSKNDSMIDAKELRASFAYKKTDRPIDALLTEARKGLASDFHILPESPAIARIAGELHKASTWSLTAEQTEKMLLDLLDEKQRERFEEQHQLDFCYVIDGVGRYRANIHRSRVGTAGVFRVIPNEMPEFMDTRLPDHLQDLVNYHQGLFIVSGPASSGKSTTLAALVNLINEQKRHHIITLEDPIEFVHPYKSSLVNQREVGKHSDGYASALRAALREDPDVIVVGELRDPDTMALAMMAAETGHLVIGTMNTTSAWQTVARLIDAFPPRRQPAVRMMLSESLKVVTSQQLLPRARDVGRVAIHEVLVVTLSISNLIRDNKLNLIPSAMVIGKAHGMQTFDMHLESTLKERLIAPEEAYRRAENKELFEAHVSEDYLQGREEA